LNGNVVFDLGGTLIDGAPDLDAIANRRLSARSPEEQGARSSDPVRDRQVPDRRPARTRGDLTRINAHMRCDA